MESRKLENTYYVTQIVAVIALLISVIYLGLQLNQNNKLLKMTSIQEDFAQANAHYKMQVNNSELAI